MGRVAGVRCSREGGCGLGDDGRGLKPWTSWLLDCFASFLHWSGVAWYSPFPSLTPFSTFYFFWSFNFSFPLLLHPLPSYLHCKSLSLLPNPISSLYAPLKSSDPWAFCFAGWRVFPPLLFVVPWTTLAQCTLGGVVVSFAKSMHGTFCGIKGKYKRKDWKRFCAVLTEPLSLISVWGGGRWGINKPDPDNANSVDDRVPHHVARKRFEPSDFYRGSSLGLVTCQNLRLGRRTRSPRLLFSDICLTTPKNLISDK